MRVIGKSNSSGRMINCVPKKWLKRVLPPFLNVNPQNPKIIYDRNTPTQSCLWVLFQDYISGIIIYIVYHE